MTQNDNEISNLFFQNEPEPENDPNTENPSEESDKSTTQTADEKSDINEEDKISMIKEDIISSDIDIEEVTEHAKDNSKKEAIYSNYQTTVIKKKRSVLAPILGICILLAVSVTAIWFVISKSKDSSNSAVNTIALEKAFEFTSPIDEAIGMDGLTDLLLSQSAKLNASMTLTSLNNYSNASGISLDFSFLRDLDKNAALAETALSYRNAALLSASTYIDKENIILKIPSLSSGVFTAKSSDFISQFEASPLFSDSLDSGTKEEIKAIFHYLDILEIEKLITSTDPKSNNLISEVLNKLSINYPDDYKKIFDGIHIETIEPDASGNNGKIITISEESIELLLKDILLLPLEKSDLLKLFIGQEGFENFGNEFADFLNQDIVITFYENSKNQIVSLNSKNSIDIDGEIINLDFFATSNSNDNPMDSITFQFDFKTDYENLSIKYINACNRNAEVLKHNQNIIISGNLEEDKINMVHSFKRSYNTVTKDYQSNIEVDLGDGDNIELNLEGNFKELDKGSNYSFTINNVDFITNDTIFFTAIGEINISKLNEEIVKPSGTEYKIFEMPYEQFSPVLDDIMKNVQSLDSMLESYSLNK